MYGTIWARRKHLAECATRKRIHNEGLKENTSSKLAELI
jgi:hypothetical protein